MNRNEKYTRSVKGIRKGIKNGYDKSQRTQNKNRTNANQTKQNKTKHWNRKIARRKQNINQSKNKVEN